MAINNFIPEIWSAKLFSDFDKAFVFSNIVNRDYEGEISGAGDTVHINAVGPITVNSYTKNSTSNITVQDLTGLQTVLQIDKLDYFAFQVDDVDSVQTKPKVMGKAMQNAAVALAQQVETRLSGLYTDAGATVVSTACGPTAVTEILGNIHRKLDENDVPRAGRWIVVPPWMQTVMFQAQLFKWVGTPAGSGAGTNGYVGDILGFNVYTCNSVTETTASGSTQRQHYVMAGTNDAITFANQIVKTEAYRQEGKFSDAVKGLHVYGYKVVQPKALVCAILAESTV